MEGEFTGETIATIVVVPLALLLSVVLFVLLRSLARRAAAKSAASAGSKWATDWDADDARLARRWSWSAPAIAVLIVVATWWGMYPWRYEYHHWVPKAGEVSTVDSRLTGTGNGAMEDKFVVKFSGDSQQYGVLDTRAAGIKPGDHLTITCVRRWQWSGTHGYDCNFVALEKDGKR